MSDSIDAIVEAAAQAAYESFYEAAPQWGDEPEYMKDSWREVAKAVILAVSQHEVKA